LIKNGIPVSEHRFLVFDGLLEWDHTSRNSIPECRREFLAADDVDHFFNLLFLPDVTAYRSR